MANGHGHSLNHNNSNRRMASPKFGLQIEFLTDHNPNLEQTLTQYGIGPNPNLELTLSIFKTDPNPSL